MTTTLAKPVTRAVTIGDVRYKVVMTTHGVRLTEHKKRRGVEVSWSSLISLIEGEGREASTTATTPGTGVPQAITQDVARELRTATAALERADNAFRSAGILPPELLAEVASDPFQTRPKPEPDWFIEPLLTLKELSSILRLPAASARSLGIPSVKVAGELRYRQSAVRTYLADNENKPASSRSIVESILSRDQPEPSRTHPQARRFKSYYNRDR